MFDPKVVKKDFPIFEKYPGLVYLDSAATSQKPKVVIDAVKNYYEEYYSSVHRGVYELSEKSTEKYEEARAKVARFINASSPEEIIFTRNATESINLVAQTWAKNNIKNGERILLSEMEHHANIVPWQMLKGDVNGEQVNGVKDIEIIGLTEDYRLDMDDYKKKLDAGDTKLVAIIHQSNVLGTINPVKKIIELAHQAGAKVLVDGAQAVPHMKVDVQELDADFYVFSGHKMLGPTGIGVLYAKKEILAEMQPFLGGGDMIKDVSYEKTVFNVLPQKFEAGTPNIAGAIGLGAAIDYLESLGMDNVFSHELELTQYALERLGEVEDLKIIGPHNAPQPPLILRGGAISFILGEAHPHDLATIFDEQQVAVRAGHHCAMPLHKLLNLPATARASFYVYNTKEDVDRLIIAIEKAKSTLS